MRLDRNRILIAGTGSGCGKTTVTIGILKCLLNRGFKVSAFKCGPDYIDPMFHSRIIGVNAGNLDPYFSSADTLKFLLQAQAEGTDISVIEGVMGYYDGIGFTSRASTFEAAQKLKTPVILVADAKGVGASVGAVLDGFLNYRVQGADIGEDSVQENNGVSGVIFNNMSEKLYRYAAEFAEQRGVKPLGYVPKNSIDSFESRHLGLVTAAEVKDFGCKVERIAELFEKNVDIDGIIKLAESAPVLEFNEPETVKPAHGRITTAGFAGQAEKDRKQVCSFSDVAGQELENANETGINININKWDNVRIAVAADEAFCFTYNANLDFLERCGCEIEYFSPIHDKKLPAGASGLILSGGYPELHGRVLSENTAMLEEIRQILKKGFPVIAECGGFMYLHESLEGADGRCYNMAGIIKGHCRRTDRLGHFGYVELHVKKDGLLGDAGTCIKAHEFHYWQSSREGGDILAVKADGSQSWRCGVITENVYAGFPHLFFYESPQAALGFVKKCMQRNRVGACI